MGATIITAALVRACLIRLPRQSLLPSPSAAQPRACLSLFAPRLARGVRQLSVLGALQLRVRAIKCTMPAARRCGPR